MRKLLMFSACLLLVFAGYLLYSTVGANAPVAVAKHKETKVYEGTIYVAGMGGHFAVAEVEIDPADAGEPIRVKNLDRIVIGSKKTHPTHDPRIDANDRTKMYWSTYKIDKSAGDRAMHVGLSDLKTGKKLIDKVVQLDDRAKWTGALYCGSGQSKKYFMPVTMTDEAWIDVFSKKDLSLKHRVFIPEYKYGQTRFYHGTNSPDMKTFAVSVNLQTKGKPNGNIDMLLLDLKSLEKGKAKIVARNKVTGAPGKTITFRQTFTPDGGYLLQSGADRFYLLDGRTLDLMDEELVEGQNHDAMPTPDGKYAILTLRQSIPTVEAPEGKAVTDGTLQLYDIEARTVIGKAVSVCYACHEKIGLGGNAILCGLDGNWK
jgi:hypothetical protein